MYSVLKKNLFLSRVSILPLPSPLSLSSPLEMILSYLYIAVHEFCKDEETQRKWVDEKRRKLRTN